MFLARTMLPAGMTATAVVSGPLRCGVPTLLGGVGTSADGDRAFALAFEWPTTWATLLGTAEEQRRQNELRQIERLRRDFAVGGQPDPFLSVKRPHSDPPDFCCKTATDEREVGVELTQLTFEDRIGEHALFERTKREVLAKGRGQLAHLRGYAITATFFDDNGKPAVPAGHGLADKLLDALRSYTPPRDPPGGGSPDQLSEDQRPAAFDGGEINAVRLQGDPGGGFYSLMRWELLLSASGWITGTDAWARLCAAAAKKDVSANNLVVFSCASPSTPSNRARPADTLLARAIVERAAEHAVPATEYVERLWLHSWLDEVVYELRPGEPGVTLICGSPFG
jgi:hypothetical protein